MDHQRAQTLQALETFIQTQRNLLSQQRLDIERLQRFKIDLVQRPSHILTNLSNELDDNAFRLSEQANCRLALPKDIHWSVFDKTDTGSLRTFAQRKRDKITQRNRPSASQCSELSELQRFVKISRRTIIDPILARFADMSSPEPESEEEIDPVELLRQQEQQKIRELKKRQIRGCGLSLPLSIKAGSKGVFIRPDDEEEAMDVDVMIDDEEVDAQPTIPPPDLDSDTSPSRQASPSPDPPPRGKMPSSNFDFQGRRSSKKTTPVPQPIDNTDEWMGAADAPRPRKKVKLKLAPKLKFDDDDEDDDFFEDALKAEGKAKRTGKRSGSAKPKPDTFKQAWSESEQNLLEQLLEQIPEGEKNRWKKISQAMGGRRTPRQVASRIQKYFEKLKKFGLSVDGGAG